ncbi:MAG: peptidyl-prolyl cis-trans isomerase C [Myxococcota bacterium]|jgi:peptidyl-prolyl cis-trans isomerase C
MRRAVDPLVPFILLGALLWAAQGWLDREAVHVSPELLSALASDWERANGHAPDAAQLMAAADAWLADELRYREGLAIGLDAGDPVVRRRIIQKVQALEAGLDPVAEPSEGELAAWLAAHPERYPAVQTARFTHVFARDDAGLLEALTAGAAPEGLGGPYPHTYDGPVDLERVSRELGDAVAEALRGAPVGQWVQVESGGLHLLRVEARPEPRPPSVERLRAALTRDWAADQAKARDARAVASRRARVEVVWPD